MSKERAIELRLAGKSRSQIAEALGLKSGGGALHRWLKDVPPPEWTKRPNAKDGLREQAVALRRQGRSYREIRDQLGVSKGTLSDWLSDVVLTEEQQERLALMRRQARTQAGRTMQAARIARSTSAIAAAQAQIPMLCESELFVAGVALYWAEGSKTKPWRSSEQVTFINSDASVIRLYLAWLELIGVTSQRLSFRIAIHETADVAMATQYWSAVIGVPAEQFMRATIKRHKPSTKRRNIGDEYHGCLVIKVRSSTDLMRQITGWWQGLVGAAVSLEARSGVV